MSAEFESAESLTNLMLRIYAKHRLDLTPYFKREVHLPILKDLLVMYSKKDKLLISETYMILNGPVSNMKHITIISIPMVARCVNAIIEEKCKILDIVPKNQSNIYEIISNTWEDDTHNNYNATTTYDDSFRTTNKTVDFYTLINKTGKFGMSYNTHNNIETDIKLIMIMRLILIARHWYDHVKTETPFSKVLKVRKLEWAVRE